MQQCNCCSGDRGQARASGGAALSPLGTNCTVLTVLVHGGKADTDCNHDKAPVQGPGLHPVPEDKALCFFFFI